MKYLGVYTAITAGFFFLGFIMGSIVEASGKAPDLSEWDLFIMGFIGVAFLMFGFSVLSYLKRVEMKVAKPTNEVDWEE
ncbi:MAG: hypothetical protein ABIE55_00900 [Candidatus Aenigmatarchaeota archaeon]